LTTSVYVEPGPLPRPRGGNRDVYE
jgi:hypothetical protein